MECGDSLPLSELCGDESPHSTNSPIGLNDDQGRHALSEHIILFSITCEFHDNKRTGCHERTVGTVLTATKAEKSRLKTAPTAVESLMAQGVNAIDMIVRGI